jgi:hypothetical protein
MAQKDWISTTDGDTRFDATSRLVIAAPADQGLRNALRGAFACTNDLPDDIDRLLARLR